MTALSALQALTIDIAQILPLSGEQQQALVERARRGNVEARERLILDCQRYVLSKAHRLVSYCRDIGRVRLEVVDVYMAGNEYMRVR